MTATAERPKRRKTATNQSNIEQTLARHEALVDQIRSFTDIIREYDEELEDAKKELAATKAAYEYAKISVREIVSIREAAQFGLVRYLMPSDGGDILPLFDRMDPADDETHGSNAQVWRQEPISAMRLSLLASKALNTAEIMLVGQLQDRVLADRDGWWQSIDALTYEIAIAVQDKLNDFINDRSAE